MDELTLRRRVRGHPSDSAGWVALAHWARRTDRAPTFLGAQDLPWVVSAWRRYPRQVDLGRLFQAATQLRPLDLDTPVVGRYWKPSRVRPQGAGFEDRVRGLPLAALHEPSGVECRWVPAPPRHQGSGSLPLAGWYVGRFPVTVAQYQRFLSATGASPPGDYQGRNPWSLQRARPERPAVFLSHREAERYCRWAGGGLPTTAEWRWAARGPGRARFPWGQAPPAPPLAAFNAGVPWRGGDWDRFLAEVGGCPEGAGAFGLEGLAGNVWEWTLTRCRRDGTEAAPGAGFFRLLLGGGWGTSRPEELGVDHMGRALDPHERTDDVGFRLFLPIPCATITPADDEVDSGGRRGRAKRARRRRRRKQRRRAR